MSLFDFDGENKIIQGVYGTSSGVRTLDIQRDLYSAWKIWVSNGDNAKFPIAFSTTGGDPISLTLSVGSYFFLENDWKIRPIEENHRAIFNGNLYTRDDSTPYLSVAGFSIVTETRNSSLTQTIASSNLSDLLDELLVGHQIAGSVGEGIKIARDQSVIAANNVQP